ncbi:RIP metalloprotease RseP [Anaerorhabdus sp.]|uniref:RIP metalloprotease RseP n=1 Tax=Anaerorhabdus sp. TaxID=1872524 RepID=UPI002FC677C9
MGVIYFILVLSVIIVIHELGHLIAAKAFGVYCYEFSLGMGPKLFSIQGKETKYSLRLIPIGGYVAMSGEQEDDMELYPNIDVPANRSIKGIARWKRVIVMLAGIAMNFALCWLIITGLLLNSGAYGISPKPIVESVVENGPAEAAGFQSGDLIKKVVLDDGTVIKPKEFDDITIFTQMYTGEVVYTVERNGELIELPPVKGIQNEQGAYMIGINSPKGEYVEITLLNAGYYSFDYMIDMTKDIFKSLARLVQGNGLDQLSGPVGIYQVTEQTASQGPTSLLLLVALLSLNVGIFNLLPLPILDGGRVVLIVAEIIIGKPLNKKFEIGLMTASMVLLFGLMIFATWQDIVRIFN